MLLEGTDWKIFQLLFCDDHQVFTSSSLSPAWV